MATVRGKTVHKDEKRWGVVISQKYHNMLSQSAIAKLYKVSPNFVGRWQKRYKETGTVSSLSKAGRSSKLSPAAIEHACRLLQEGSIRTIEEATKEVHRELRVRVSSETLRRGISAHGMSYRCAKKCPLLTDLHKLKRMQFARDNRRRAWKGVMFTDSSLFLIYPLKSAHALKAWGRNGSRCMAQLPKHSGGVHVYMGVTCYGCTDLIFVTGTAGQKSQHINPKTGRMHAGVCSAEYMQVVEHGLLPAGLRLFNKSALWKDKWTFQQDGAPPHRSVSTVKYIEQHCPGGLLKGWPPNSPDLSWIENIWAWMDRQLRKRPQQPKTVQQLKAALCDIKESIPLEMLQRCVKGMAARMQTAIRVQGGHIGK